MKSSEDICEQGVSLNTSASYLRVQILAAAGRLLKTEKFQQRSKNRKRKSSNEPNDELSNLKRRKCIQILYENLESSISVSSDAINSCLKQSRADKLNKVANFDSSKSRFLVGRTENDHAPKHKSIPWDIEGLSHDWQDWQYRLQCIKADENAHSDSSSSPGFVGKREKSPRMEHLNEDGTAQHGSVSTPSYPTESSFDTVVNEADEEFDDFDDTLFDDLIHDTEKLSSSASATFCLPSNVECLRSNTTRKASQYRPLAGGPGFYQQQVHQVSKKVTPPFLRSLYPERIEVEEKDSAMPLLTASARTITCFRVAEARRLLIQNLSDQLLKLELYAVVQATWQSVDRKYFAFADVFFPHRPPYVVGFLNAMSAGEIPSSIPTTRPFQNGNDYSGAEEHLEQNLVRLIVRTRRDSVSSDVHDKTSMLKERSSMEIISSVQTFDIQSLQHAAIVDILDFRASDWYEVEYVRGIVDPPTSASESGESNGKGNAMTSGSRSIANHEAGMNSKNTKSKTAVEKKVSIVENGEDRSSRWMNATRVHDAWNECFGD